jgi:ABC-type transport system substrate-binding protein
MQGSHDYLARIGKDNVADVLNAEHRPKKELQDLGIDVLLTPGIWFSYIAFNMEDPVVGGEKNKFLRRAMSMALDEVPMIEKFYLGLATRADSPVPPGVGGYDPGYRNPSREYNLVKAREILAKAGHPNGEGIPELVYETKTDATYRQLGEYFQRAMAELGIKVKLATYTWPELLGRVRRKQAQLWQISWVYDYPDAENGWQLLYSKNVSPGSNEANYKNPKFDALYEKIATMPDSPERFKLYARMRDIFAEDVPWIITVNLMETRMTHSWLHNLKIHSFEHNVEKYLRLDTAERARHLR